MLEIQKINKAGLFFNQYRYSIGVHLYGAHCLRGWPDVDCNKLRNRILFNNSMARNFINKDEEQDLYDLLDIISNLNQPVKLVCYHNYLYVYVQDCSKLEKFFEMKNRYMMIREANDIYEKNCIYLKKSTFPFRRRAYFQNYRLSDKELDSLISFFDSNREEISVNKRLNISIRQINSRYKLHKFISRSDFVDYNNSGIILMLNIIIPNLVRKTLEIKAK
jgi:hypothetical protein